LKLNKLIKMPEKTLKKYFLKTESIIYKLVRNKDLGDEEKENYKSNE